MDEIDLDFLETQLSTDQNVEQAASALICNDLDVGLCKNKHGSSKRLEMAQTIAKVDQLVQEIDNLKLQNSLLQQQLKDFQMTAQQVQDLYVKEKSTLSIVKNNFDKLQMEYSKIDVDLTNMSMVNEQMKARLAEYEGRPINFDNLVVKYVNVVEKLEGEDILKYNSDKDLLVRLREYCATMKLKIKTSKSPKKSKSRKAKIKTQDAFVQCILLENVLSKHECLRCVENNKIGDPNEQGSTTKRDQASQYISTMITRQTNTEKIIRKHVQTMFPEPPAIADILETFSSWSNIRSISPLLQSPTRVSSKEILKKFSTIGTCTMLCNVRRKIDYLPLKNACTIKQELFTPSVSPTPINPTPISRSRVGSLANNGTGNVNNSSVLDLFHSTTNLSLEQLSSNAFNELWQIFGNILLSLLQSSNANAANVNQAPTFNQQQFLDWMRQLYINSRNQTTSTVQTQTLEQSDNNISTSPLHFDNTSVLFSNVVRPQPQRSRAPETYPMEVETNVSLNANINVNNSTSDEPKAISLDVRQNSYSNESNDKQNSSSKNKLQTTSVDQSILDDFNQTNTSRKDTKPSKTKKNKHNILKEIQELHPEIDLNEKKFKALKKILRNNNHRKKAFECRRDKIANSNNSQLSSDIILTNKNNNDTAETAIDFIKSFAVSEDINQPLEENFSESEKQFLQQISNEKIANNVPNLLKADKIKSITSVHSTLHTQQPLSNNCSDAFLKSPVKHKQFLMTSKQIKSTYQSLFGESDSELEEQENEIKNSRLNNNPVIKNIVKLSSYSNVTGCRENIKVNPSNFDNNQVCTNQGEVGKTTTSVCADLSVDKNVTSRNTFKLPTTPLDNVCNYNSSQETFISDKVLTSCFYPIENTKDSKCNNLDTTIAPERFNSFENIENHLENYLGMLSDDGSIKSNDAAKTRIGETEIVLNKELEVIREMKGVNDRSNYSEHDCSKSANKTNIFNINVMSPLENCLEEMTNSSDENKCLQCHNDTPQMEPNDFARDFELSSDEEEDVDATKQYSSISIGTKSNEIFNEKLNSNCVNSSELESYAEEDVCLKSKNPKLNKEEDEKSKATTFVMEVGPEDNRIQENKHLNSILQSTIPSYNSLTQSLNTNNNEIDIEQPASQKKFEIDSKKDIENVVDKTHNEIGIKVRNISVNENENILKLAVCAEWPNTNQEIQLNTQDSKLENIAILSTESTPLIMDTVDEYDFNDSLSIENELLIDDDINDLNNLEQSSIDPLMNSVCAESGENGDETMNSTNISKLFNSTLYNDVLSESISPIVDDLLKEEMETTEIKPKRERKRKSECVAETQPCKRSERLKAKQISLETSLNLINTPIELGKYTKGRMNIINKNVQLKAVTKEDLKINNIKQKVKNSSNLVENKNTLGLGFFRERSEEGEAILENNKSFSMTKFSKPELSAENPFIISNDTTKPHQSEQKVNSTECEQQKDFSNYKKGIQNKLSVDGGQEREKSDSQKSLKLLEDFPYSESPLSPVPMITTNEHVSERFVNIPVERLPMFTPKDDIQTLFDILIKSYKNENHNQVLESATSKEFRRHEYILNQFEEQLKLYCYNEMELDLYCTSAHVINKILSISPNYSLLQKALINIAQNAEWIDVPENSLHTTIQEMPPHHLSKCLQRLFPFLKNMVTRNTTFCKDLISKIESELFNTQQASKLSLGSTLNLTQLFLMCCKVQEYLEIHKHPARLFIVKCLYFHMKKWVIMIHEVLMWYPTVLPHREDKTYNRSDALISVIQQILMNTKYEMDRNKTVLPCKLLLSKLRYEYHFEVFKPTQAEIIDILVEKLKNSKLYNISLAFCLLCRNIGPITTQYLVLNQHLLPLANEYYNLALKTDEYDERIAVLLETISMIVKPLPIETDTQKYFNEFSRFLNGFERQLVQEAALCSILRLQRFNVIYCYNLLCHFQPTYDLKPHTQAMLKTFLYRRSLSFWKNLSQNAINLN